MEEKTMVNDILEATKAELKSYEGIILEAENMQFRNTMQQLRNNGETFQYDLFRIAQSKGYYKPATQASQTEIDQVKTELQQ